MLDTKDKSFGTKLVGYLVTQDRTEGAIQHLPVSRDQYPVSASTDKGFRCRGMDRMRSFMQRWGKIHDKNREVQL